MTSGRLPTLAPASSFHRAVRDSGGSLRDRYRDDPMALAERFHLKFPEKPVFVMIRLGVISEQEAAEKFDLSPGIREWVLAVLVEDERSTAVVANRGGGKSQGVSFIEFVMTFIHDFESLNLGGSELQADQVYQYLVSYVQTDEEWKKLVDGELMRERTNLVNGNWIRVLAASSKSVRSPHAGGWRAVRGQMVERGGLLVIDEEAEADVEIVEAALSTVDTARPSVSIRSSTFHNAVGSFADLIDNHVSMGYRLFRWDIFDVAERCGCVGGCQSEEKCFREDHVEKIIDPDTGQEEQRLIHKAYCGGRAAYADGWIRMEEIVSLWKRLKRNHERWEVEAMGSRPSTKGFVIKDRIKFSENIVEQTGDELYLPGYAISVTVDWGSVAGALEAWQAQVRDGTVKHALLVANLIEEAGLEEILGAIVGIQQRWPMEVTEFRCDIGGGGNYLNPYMRDAYNFDVVDVNFQQEKEAAVAAWNILSEGHKILIPKEHEDFISQTKRWRRRPGSGQIQKGNDHLCDAGVCYFAKFIEELGVSNVRIVPRGFDTSGRGAPEIERGIHGERLAPDGRVAAARGFGSTGTRRSGWGRGR